MDPPQSSKTKHEVEMSPLMRSYCRLNNEIRDIEAEYALRKHARQRMSIQPSKISRQDILQNPELLRTLSISSQAFESDRFHEYKEMFPDNWTTPLDKRWLEEEIVFQNFTNMRLTANCYESLAYLQNNRMNVLVDPDLVGLEISSMGRLKTTLDKLRSLIEPLDSLRCKDNVIPKDSAEIKEILKTLKDIDWSLNNLKCAITTPGKLLINFMAMLDKFMGEYKEVENIQADFENAIGKLQALVLEGTPLFLPSKYN